MKLLVTGGAGFIGSNFVQYILEKYPTYEVINLDALTYAGSLDNLKEVKNNRRHKFVQGRIEDGKLVDKVMEGIDAVINFAAESHVDRSILEPQVFISTNVLGTQVLLDSALRHKIKLFYQISTDEVYGALKLGTKKRFTEGSPPPQLPLLRQQDRSRPPGSSLPPYLHAACGHLPLQQQLWAQAAP